MKCVTCNSDTAGTDAFCGNCGTPIVRQTAPARPVQAQPHYVSASEVQGKPSNGPKIAIGLALLAGLLLGGLVAWRMHARAPAGQAAAAVENRPPPVLERPTAAAEEKEVAVPAPAPPPRRIPIPKKPAPIKQTSAPPQLIAQDSPAPVVENPPVTTAPPNERSRPAVQEPESESAPMPVVTSNPATAARTNPIQGPEGTGAIAPPPPPTPASPIPARPTYTGPRSGFAIWSGKLEKGQSLTISGGNASMGVLSGAGLPGVPVRVTIDQTNLGFGEMPSQANGFRTLVLRSHGKHDKITIRWEVVQP